MRDELKNKMDKYIKECVLYYDLPGLIIGVGFCNSNYKYEGAAGVRNIETKEVLTPDAIFHTCSTTKLFTCMAIFMLIEENKLELDDKIVDLIGNDYSDRFETKNAAYISDARYKDVTIRHILTHTSGLFESEFLYHPNDKRFVYADPEYDVLGEVIEKVTGIPFDEYIYGKILEPLNMHNSEISVRQRENLVSAHSKNSDNEIVISPYFDYSISRAPSSGLTSTVADMAKWAEEVLVKKTLIKRDTYDIILREYVETPDNQHMCMSWFKRIQSGYTLYGHFGSDIGYRTGFWICPELNLYFTVLSNITRTPINKICSEVFDIIRETSITL